MRSIRYRLFGQPGNLDDCMDRASQTPPIQVALDLKRREWVGAADMLVNLMAYYIHERVWLRIRFGRKRPPEYQI